MDSKQKRLNTHPSEEKSDQVYHVGAWNLAGRLKRPQRKGLL